MIRAGTLAMAVLVCGAWASQARGQGTAYACQSSREFYSVNLGTGAKTFLRNLSGNLGVSATLTYDCVTGTAYTSSTLTNVGVQKQLYTLNLATGLATAVGPYGDLAVFTHALEIDTRTGHLYGISHHNSGLYHINKATGAATLIGPTGFTGQFPFASLGYDSTNFGMYAVNAATDSLYRLDLISGAATLIGPLNGPVNSGGMAYNADNQTMYMVDNDNDILYTINLSTGNATPVGPTGVGNLIGFVYVSSTAGSCASRCPVDYNSNGAVTVQDIFDYLSGYFGGDPRADFNASGLPGSVQDIFDFLGAYFVGCP